MKKVRSPVRSRAPESAHKLSTRCLATRIFTRLGIISDPIRFNQTHRGRRYDTQVKSLIRNAWRANSRTMQILPTIHAKASRAVERQRRLAWHSTRLRQKRSRAGNTLRLQDAKHATDASATQRHRQNCASRAEQMDSAHHPNPLAIPGTDSYRAIAINKIFGITVKLIRAPCSGDLLSDLFTQL